MFTVYILFSENTQKYHIGQTQDLQNRLIEHNSGETKSLRLGIPWNLVWRPTVETRKEAITLEKKIKNTGSKRFLYKYGS